MRVVEIFKDNIDFAVLSRSVFAVPCAVTGGLCRSYMQTRGRCHMPYIPKPKPCYLDGFEFYQVINSRKVYRSGRLFYSWDEFHGEIEVFTKQGHHLGALDGVTGEQIKSARKDRRLYV